MLNTKNLGILAVITVVVALLAVMLSQKPDNRLEGSGELLYPELLDRVNQVARVEISADGKTFTLERQNQQWGLKEKGHYPVALDRVRQLLLGLTELRIVEPKTAKPEHYAKLHLQAPDQPEAKSVAIRLLDPEGKTLAELLVGKQSPSRVDPTQSDIYVRKLNADQSWLTRGSLALQREATAWLDKDIADLNRDQIVQVTLTQPDGESLTVVADQEAQNGFRLAEPIPEDKTLESPYLLGSIAATLSRLQLQDVKPAAEVEFAEDQLIRAEFQARDGRRVIVEGQEIDGDFHARLRAEYVAPETGEAGSAGQEADAATQTDGADGEAEAKAGETEPDPAQQAEEAKKQIAELERRVTGWVYVLPPYKAENLQKSRDDLLTDKIEEDAASGDALANPGTVSGPPPQELIELLGKPR